MQNKGPIRLFLILLAVVSIYQLFFTWKAKSVEKQAYRVMPVTKAETSQIRYPIQQKTRP